jgi:hypothetical protein
MQTLKAIVLNIIYPGTGYLYLKNSFRKQIAIFLICVWTLFLSGIIYELIKAWVTNNPYLFNSPMEVPFLAVIMWGAMIVDTYFLAKKLQSKQHGRK